MTAQHTNFPNYCVHNKQICIVTKKPLKGQYRIVVMSISENMVKLSLRKQIEVLIVNLSPCILRVHTLPSYQRYIYNPYLHA